MNRRLPIMNLVGVAVLAVVCVLQWQRERALNLDLNRREKARLEQQAKMSEQEKNLRGMADDLALFKEQLGRAQAESADSRKKLQDLESENLRLTNEGEQLRQSLTNWSRAVTERDARISEANARIRDLSDQLNATVSKFNELVTNYNRLSDRNTDLAGKNSAQAPQSSQDRPAGDP